MVITIVLEVPGHAHLTPQVGSSGRVFFFVFFCSPPPFPCPTARTPARRCGSAAFCMTSCAVLPFLLHFSEDLNICHFPCLPAKGSWRQLVLVSMRTNPADMKSQNDGGFDNKYRSISHMCAAFSFFVHLHLALVRFFFIFW